MLSCLSNGSGSRPAQIQLPGSPCRRGGLGIQRRGSGDGVPPVDAARAGGSAAHSGGSAAHAGPGKAAVAGPYATAVHAVNAVDDGPQHALAGPADVVPAPCWSFPMCVNDAILGNLWKFVSGFARTDWLWHRLYADHGAQGYKACDMSPLSAGSLKESEYVYDCDDDCHERPWAG